MAVWTATRELLIGGAMMRVGVLTGVSQAPGSATNDNASAGNLGEYVTSQVTCATATGLSNGVSSNVTTISLTAGDWDVWGAVGVDPAGTTVLTSIQGGIGGTSGAMPSAGFPAYAAWAGSVTGATHLNVITIGPRRESFSGTNTVYLVVNATFTTSTAGGCGYIIARRVR